MTFRLLTLADEPLLWRALYDALHVPPGQAPPPHEIVHRPDLARYVEAWGTRAGDIGLAVTVDGTDIGAAWLRRWADAETGGYGFVNAATPELSVALDAAHRGRGLVLSRALALAARGAEAVSLSVSATNSARRLYARAGFVEVDRVDGSITMRKRF